MSYVPRRTRHPVLPYFFSTLSALGLILLAKALFYFYLLPSPASTKKCVMEKRGNFLKLDFWPQKSPSKGNFQDDFGGYLVDNK